MIALLRRLFGLPLLDPPRCECGTPERPGLHDAHRCWVLDTELAETLDAECAAHGATLGALRRESAELVQVRQQRDAARVAETMCSVRYCPRCDHDVECLPGGWWCDECTRAHPEGARGYGYREIAKRVNGLGYVGLRFPLWPPWTERDEALMKQVDGLADSTSDGGADDPRPCARCTARVPTLSARDWCYSCEEQDTDELAERKKVLAAYDQRKRDEELIERAHVLGEEIAPGQRDRRAAVEGAAITLRHHWVDEVIEISADTRCGCGWVGYSHATHVAEQLAAVGALGNSQAPLVGSAPVLVDRDGDEWQLLDEPAYAQNSEEYSGFRRSHIEAQWGPVTEKAT